MDKVLTFKDSKSSYHLSGAKAKWKVVVTRNEDNAQISEVPFTRKKLALAWITQQGAT
jgi:hypothetical protein